MLAGSAKPTKVLLVDDVRLFLELEKTFFRRQGCEIFTATTGTEALTVVHKEKPDLVVLDLSLPEMDGLEVLKRIRASEMLRGIKVIIASVSGEEEDIKNCKEAGCDAYLTKPVTQRVLLDTAARILGIPQRVDIRIWIEMQVEGSTNGSIFYGQSDNISIGGIYVRCERDFPIGSQIALGFTLPDENEPLSTTGELLRIEKLPPVEGKSTFGLAFRFVSLTENARRQIQHLIDKKIS